MKNEAKFWKNDLKHGFKSMGDANRLESHATSVGRPDVNVCLVGGIVWDLELKYSNTNHTRLRPAQRGWLFRRRRVGGNCGVLTKWEQADTTLYLFNIRFPDNNDMYDWEQYADAVWESKIDWAELEHVLRTEHARTTERYFGTKK